MSPRGAGRDDFVHVMELNAADRDERDADALRYLADISDRHGIDHIRLRSGGEDGTDANVVVVDRRARRGGDDIDVVGLRVEVDRRRAITGDDVAVGRRRAANHHRRCVLSLVLLTFTPGRQHREHAQQHQHQIGEGDQPVCALASRHRGAGAVPGDRECRPASENGCSCLHRWWTRRIPQIQIVSWPA